MNHVNEFMNVKINIIEDSKIRKASANKAISKKSLTGYVNFGDFCTGPSLSKNVYGNFEMFFIKIYDCSACKPEENILG